MGGKLGKSISGTAVISSLPASTVNNNTDENTYGRVNIPSELVTYTGKETETTITTVDNSTRTIAVDVKDIGSKQDKLLFIPVYGESGTMTSENLAKLISDLNNQIL